MRYFPHNQKEIKVDVNQCVSQTFVRQPSLVDSFYYEDDVHPRTGAKCKNYHNPLYMLFNQQRLDRLGPAAVQQWIDSMDSAQHSQLNELRQKCTDDDLIAMVRSRNIQHPCEFERYIHELNQRADTFNSEVARVRAEMEAEREQQIPDVES